MKNIGVWVGLLLLLFAGIIFWQSLSLEYYGQYGPGPGLLPIWLSGLLGVLSIIYIFSSLKEKNNSVFDLLPKGKVLMKLLSILGSIFLFIIISPYSGFVIASMIVLLILLSPEYKWYSSLGISAAITMILFLGFKTVLNIPLPVNMWGW
ncbi:tripartite tricarboxylate transporter TctB family protein [Metabacillus sp. Hm71]|uniref:tripartite tricarboxylate transporter TctB family protein n=1 Tax=Metabacillus sp. Hm71 TaxID=3450743 RepID=UPI003F43554D